MVPHVAKLALIQEPVAVPWAILLPRCLHSPFRAAGQIQCVHIIHIIYIICLYIYIYYIYIFYERPGNMLDQFSHRTELDRSHPLIGKTDEIWGIRSTLKVFLCQVSSISKCRTGARPRHQFRGPQLSASHSISCVQKITFCSMTWLAVPST